MKNTLKFKTTEDFLDTFAAYVSVHQVAEDEWIPKLEHLCRTEIYSSNTPDFVLDGLIDGCIMKVKSMLKESA